MRPGHLAVARADSQARAANLFEDVWQLGANSLPLLPLRTGGTGQPRYFATGTLPPAALDHFVDDVWWRPGVYGTVDLTGLPDAVVDGITLNQLVPDPAQPALSAAFLRFSTEGLHYDIPFSRAEYVKGPLGADATRVRFGRAFSRRMNALLHLTVNNADGFVNPSGGLVRLPAGIFKAGVRLDYRLTQNWQARYRYWVVSAEAGVTAPFFPEEWHRSGNNRHKETRRFHAVELARGEQMGLRAFWWALHEELNAITVKIRHRLREAGLETNWRGQRGAFAAIFSGRVSHEKVESPIIDYAARLHAAAGLKLAVQLNEKLAVQAMARVRHSADWPAGYTLAVGGIYRPKPAWSLWLGMEQRRLPPAPGERNNSLPLLARSDRLNAVTLQHLQAGLAYERRGLTARLVCGNGWWQEGLVWSLNHADTTATLRNDTTVVVTPALHLELQWRPLTQLAAGFHAAHALRAVPQQFWFWHQPRTHVFAYVAVPWLLFDHDLELTPRFAARMIGERFSPDFSATPGRVNFTRLAPVRVIDLQLQLRHGDGAVFLAWENLLDHHFEWRAGAREPGRVFRWGFWWKFLN
ncbi:MAG: hypothetical protein ONB48_10770 [candidate division KSB1 bacterium]|nr:hypothetical protein [candidate division KSB1 bacterium]MDZ7286126.1 hypothetical protein [candidate division KSB1 bacterium]MDZ7296352.1 hypothetical protein [candidate division KSB1 bacterium]MDZ7307128.1 hypothetical protein [candidate division KSB1 bacterium]MDZ7347219.1 hypothetical protein [candidate division KSB1 bacterium]